MRKKLSARQRRKMHRRSFLIACTCTPGMVLFLFKLYKAQRVVDRRIEIGGGVPSWGSCVAEQAEKVWLSADAVRAENQPKCARCGFIFGRVKVEVSRFDYWQHWCPMCGKTRKEQTSL